MQDEIKARFKSLGSFPSPPGIAQEIIKLAKDPEVSLGDVTAAIAKDPALATKVLRIANSAAYAQRRQSQNLRQALTTIGLDAAMTLCLGFSIAGSFRAGKAGSINYPSYWRHSLIAGLGSRCVAEAVGLEGAEDLFLAGLLQDIGVLALDRAKPGFYADLPAGADHAARVAYERERLEEDHAALGGWLLETWNLPETLVRAVSLSHAPERAERASDQGRFIRCVALGGELAAACLAADRAAAFEGLAGRAASILSMSRETLAATIGRVAQLTPDFGSLFDTTLLSAEDAMNLTEEAQEILAARSVESLQQIGSLKYTASALTARSAELEDVSRRDGLTGLFNRRHLDSQLESEFAAARAGGWALGVLFIDLDHFKRINDTYGHAAGDTVLKGAADVVKKALRNTDLLARYGGEEFVALLPGAAPIDAHRLGERILAALRATPHEIEGRGVVVTASLGLAVHTPTRTFATAAELVAAADAAVYVAKRAGRDRMAGHGIGPGTSLAEVG